MAMSPRLLRPLASGFSLRQVAGLLDWWDASVTSTLVLNAGAVEQWNPIVGSRPLTQAIAASRPGTGTVNGRTSVLLDGSNDHLFNPTLGSQTKTIIAVIAPNATGTQGILGEGDANNTANRKFLHASGGFVSFTRQTTAIGSVAVKGAGTPQIAVASYDTVEALRVDGITSGGTPSALASTSDGFVIGARFLSGTASTFYNGHVCEVATFNRVLTLSEIQRIEGALAWKWGIQSQLPYDHPYALSFPGYGSQTTPTDSDALTYLAAVAAADGTGVEVGVANAVDDFVKGCKSDGIWSAIKASCILAGARTLAGALVPLAGSAPTPFNFAAGDYDRATGLVGNGTNKSLSANRLANSDPTDNCHMAAYVSTVGTQAIMGSNANPANHTLSNGAHRNRTTTAGLFTASLGLVGTSRAASADYSLRNGGSTSTITQASSAASANDLIVFNTFSFFGNHRIAYYSFGESIDLAALDARVSTLITAIGAFI